MNDMTIGSQAATTPFLGSYQGLDSTTLNSLAGLQANYHQQAPKENQANALQDLYSARDATDPQLRAALIADAVKQLTPAGAAQPLQLGAAASAGGSPAASQGVGGSNVMTGAPISTLNPASSDLMITADGKRWPSSVQPIIVSGGSYQLDTTGSDPSLTADTSANTVDTGRYLITASTSQAGQLTIHDKETGKDTVVWGDPHISVGGKDTAEFQNDGLSLKLDDGTTVQIQPTAVDAGGHSYINQVAVTKGDQAVTMSGLHDGGLHTSGVMNGQAQSTQQSFDEPNEIDLTEGDDDQLYAQNANGSMGSQIANTGSGEVNLDQLASNASQPTNNTGSMTQLQQAIQNFSSGFMQMMMNSVMAQVMSNSG